MTCLETVVVGFPFSTWHQPALLFCCCCCKSSRAPGVCIDSNDTSTPHRGNPSIVTEEVFISLFRESHLQLQWSTRSYPSRWMNENFRSRMCLDWLSKAQDTNQYFPISPYKDQGTLILVTITENTFVCGFYHFEETCGQSSKSRAHIPNNSVLTITASITYWSAKPKYRLFLPKDIINSKLQ